MDDNRIYFIELLHEYCMRLIYCIADYMRKIFAYFFPAEEWIERDGFPFCDLFLCRILKAD